MQCTPQFCGTPSSGSASNVTDRWWLLQCGSHSRTFIIDGHVQKVAMWLQAMTCVLLTLDLLLWDASFLLSNYIFVSWATVAGINESLGKSELK